MTKKFVYIVAITFLFISINVSAGEPDKIKVAILAAENWLMLIDGGDYIKSWQEAAQYFKNVVEKRRWQHSMMVYRKPLGRVIYRKLTSSVYRTSLPGAPDEEYVVIQFETSFENKRHAIETVTPMLDKDGKWRVSGYYIR